MAYELIEGCYEAKRCGGKPWALKWTTLGLGLGSIAC